VPPAAEPGAAQPGAPSGVSNEFTLGVPFSKAVGAGSIDGNAAMVNALMLMNQVQGDVARAAIVAAQQALTSIIGSFAGTGAERARLTGENAALRSEIDLKEGLRVAREALAAELQKPDPDPILVAQWQAGIDDFMARIRTPDIPVAQDRAQLAANENRLANLQDQTLVGFTNAVNKALDRLTATLRDAGAFDQVLAGQLTAIAQQLREFLQETKRRRIERLENQEKAEEGSIEGREGEERAQHVAVSAEALLRQFKATGEPIPENDNEGGRADTSADKIGEDTVDDAQSGRADAAQLAQNDAGADAHARTTDVDATGSAEPIDLARNTARDIARDVNGTDGVRPTDTAAFMQRAEVLLAAVEQALDQLNLAAGSSVSVAAIQDDPSARLKLPV